MDIDAITGPAVRYALRAVRYAKPLRASPLLSLATVTLRLRSEGVADTPQTREWELGRVLEDVVWDQLLGLRGQAKSGATPPSPDEELASLEADFRAENIELEAWGMTYFRYFAQNRTAVGDLAARLCVTDKTLGRRLERGHHLLVDALREAELKAIAAVATRPGAPVTERVVVTDHPPNNVGDDAAATLERLLLAVRTDDVVTHLSPAEVEEIGRYPVADLTTYRLGRVVEWSQPRYRLDERFVALTLLVDQGEESVSGRWRSDEKRYLDLRDLLAEVDQPAIVVLGPPGSGKSTLLRRLELDLAVEGLRDSDVSTTYFVSLGQWHGEGAAAPLAPRAWLNSQWTARFPGLPSLETLLSHGNMVLLLDALNEIPHAGFTEYRERVTLWKQFVQQLAAEGRGNRIVFSCRSLDYSTRLSTPDLRVPQVQIEPMSDEQVHRFLAVYQPAVAGALWSQLEHSHHLDLVRVAYFARLLVEQSGEAGVPPEGRAALFTGLVRRALRREIERDNPLFAPNGLVAERDYKRIVAARTWKTPWELPARGSLVPALANLAYTMQTARTQGEVSQVRVSYDDALAMLDNERAADIVAAGLDLGVLDEDRDRDEILFYHQLLQEYFAARQLATAPEPELVWRPWRVEDVRPGLREVLDTLPAADTLPTLPQTGWEETTLLASALVDDPAAYLQCVKDANLALGGRAAALPDIRTRLPAEFLSELSWALVSRSRDLEADLRDRIACAYAAGDLGDPRLVEGRGPDGRFLLPPTVSLQGGVYMVGDDQPIYYHQPLEGDPDATRDHVPRHPVEIASAEIGQFQTTNAEWACFMDAQGYDDERWWETPDAQRWRLGELPNEGALYSNRYWRRKFEDDTHLFERMVESGAWPPSAVDRWREWIAMDTATFEHTILEHTRPQRRSEPRLWRDKRFNHPSQPVVGISWYEARAFCAWLTVQSGYRVRLPSEVEWEAAARGREGRPFPWGAEFDRLRANVFQTHIRTTTPVGVFPEGDTPE